MSFFQETRDALLKETVFKAVHKSGLTVVVIPKKGYSESYAAFSTKFGSINTRFIAPGETGEIQTTDGVAHFLEHKVFEQPDGTNAFDQFAKYGGNANAFTSFGVTNYLFSATENFYDNLGVLLDYVQKPYFTDQNVEKEKGIIAQEVRMYDDDPGQTCFYNCLKGLYHSHPVRIEIAGAVEEVMKIDKEMLYKCYNTFYHPSNMALICVGDVSPDKVWALVEKNVDKGKAPGEIRRIFPAEPDAVAKTYREARLEVSMPLFTLGFKDVKTGGSGKELLRREIASSILLDMLFGRSGKTYNSLYEEGLINSSFGADYDYEDSFAFAMVAGSVKDPEKVRDRLFAAIEDAKTGGLDGEAFRRFKKTHYGSMIRGLNDVEDLGTDYMFCFHRGINLFDYPRICEDVTLKDINERLFELLDTSRTCLSVVMPK